MSIWARLRRIASLAASRHSLRQLFKRSVMYLTVRRSFFRVGEGAPAGRNFECAPVGKLLVRACASGRACLFAAAQRATCPWRACMRIGTARGCLSGASSGAPSLDMSIKRSPSTRSLRSESNKHPRLLRRSGNFCLTGLDKITIIGNAQLYNGLIWDEGGRMQ